MARLARRPDQHLLEKMKQYAGWQAEASIPYGSRVIPVQAAMENIPWVIPSEKVTRILQQARSIAVQDCVCRAHYGHCDAPLEVCLLLDDAADDFVGRGTARPITHAECLSVLETADGYGLVHLAVYQPQRHPLSICSCCSCCCYQLRFLLALDRIDLVVRSEYSAQLDVEACNGCGECVRVCLFGARSEPEQAAADPATPVVHRAERCYGCGLCVGPVPNRSIDFAPPPQGGPTRVTAPRGEPPALLRELAQRSFGSGQDPSPPSSPPSAGARAAGNQRLDGASLILKEESRP